MNDVENFEMMINVACKIVVLHSGDTPSVHVCMYMQ